MKKLMCLAMAAMMVLMLAACGGSAAPASNAPAGDASASEAPVGDTSAAEGGEVAAFDGDEVFIGGLAPLSGEVSQYGIMASNGAKLAVKEINDNGGVLGVPVRFDLLDEQGDATEAVAAYNKLVQDGMVALWGDVTTKPSIAVAQRAVEDNIPMITPTGTGAEITEGRGNVFRACFTDPYQARLMAAYAADEMGAKTAAVLFDSTDDYSEGVCESFEEKAVEKGMEILTVESYESGASDFNAQLTKIKSLNPDVIMAPCYYEDASKIIVQARSLGIEAKFLGPDGWASLLGYVDESNMSALDGCYYSNRYDMASPSAEMQTFIDDFTAEFGEAPDMFAMLGYEAMYIMCEAIENAGNVDGNEITEAMHRIQYEGLYGAVTFENGNDPDLSACIVEFVDGEEVSLGQFDAD